jgi:hypothetical protein
MSAPRTVHGLTKWLMRHGALIDKDASVQVTQAKGGGVITFDWAYDKDRSAWRS